MSDNQKKYAHGCLQVNFVGRVTSEPKVNSNQAQNGGEPFESVFVNVVCSPYRGKEDPDSIFVGVNFSGASVAMAKKLVKGDTIAFSGQILRAPKIYKAKDGDRVSLEIRASREAGSLHVFHKNGNGNGNGAPANTGSTEASPNPFDESDIPF